MILCLDPKKCKIKKEIDILSDKWTVLIIRLYFNNKKLTFNELKKQLKPITSKVLSEKLKKLVKEDYLKKQSLEKIYYIKTLKLNKLETILNRFTELP